MDLLIQFAKISLGIACVIREFVQQELCEKTLTEVPIGFVFPKREVGFVCRKDDENRPLLKYFFSDN